MREDSLKIVQQDRKILKEHQSNAFQLLKGKLESSNLDQVMFALMNYSFWLRVDLELLLRAAYWKDLSTEELGQRIVYDQDDLLKVTFHRLGADKKIAKEAAGAISQSENNQNVQAIAVESNQQIIEKLIYRRVELKSIWGKYYKFLSKLSHPDPFFVFFPSELRSQIDSDMINILQRCSSDLEVEWKILELDLKK